MTNEEALNVLNDVVGLGETTLVVRSGDAIAEVMGRHHYSLSDGWVTIGQEQGSHIHLKAADVSGLRFSDGAKDKPGTCGLEVLGADGRVLLKMLFRRTNPSRAADYDEGVRRTVRERLSPYAPQEVA